jgi:hypothetical protein
MPSLTENRAYQRKLENRVPIAHETPRKNLEVGNWSMVGDLLIMAMTARGRGGVTVLTVTASPSM